VIAWYNILHGLNLLNLPDEKKTENEEIAKESEKLEDKAEKPKTKPAKKPVAKAKK
jgi:hypothetical protein